MTVASLAEKLLLVAVLAQLRLPDERGQGTDTFSIRQLRYPMFYGASCSVKTGGQYVKEHILCQGHAVWET